MAVEIRPFRPADEPTVRGLAERLSEGFATWRDIEKVRDAVSSWIDSALESHADVDHLVLVAEHDSIGVVGFIGVEARDHYISGRDGYIGELAVDATVEGQGIGRRLVSEAETWARSRGCERLTLQTGAANHGARHFYERLNFDYEDVSLARSIDPDSNPP